MTQFNRYRGLGHGSLQGLQLLQFLCLFDLNLTSDNFNLLFNLENS